MRFVIVIVLFMVCSFAGVAQSRTGILLFGNVTDGSTNLPLAGASLNFSDARIGAVADSLGNYKVQNVPAGHHLIEVSFTGYTAIVVHIDLKTSVEKNFILLPAIIENAGVTVTGVSTATSTRKTPVPVTLVRKTQLLQTPSTNIIDALSRQPGVSQVSTGPAISKPVIRGLGYNRVVVLNDGARQEGQQWGDEHGIEIDEASVNRAEIVKGPASIMYGSDALAGVIHFITNVPAPDGTVRGNVFTSYQTNNGQVGLNANLQGSKKGFNWNAYASSKSARDYKNRYDGRVLNSRFNEKNFGGYIGINKSWGFSHLIFSSFNQNIGLVEGERDEATGEFVVNAGSSLERIATVADLQSRNLFTPKQNVQHYKLLLDNNFNIGKSRLKVNVGYQNNLRSEFGNPEDPSEKELAFDLKTTSYSVQWRLPEVSHFETTIGFNGMYQKNNNKGEEVIIPEYSLFDAGGFAFTQKSFERVTLSGGIRFDSRAITSKGLMIDSEEKFTPFKRVFSNVSGSAGISYQPTEKLTFKANMAKGFRSPTLSELASNGAHEGTNRYEYGSLNLTSEKSFQADAGAELDYEHVTFSINAFSNKIRDFIFYARLNSAFGGDSIIVVDNEHLEAFGYNQNNANLSGFEASLDIHPHPLDWLHINNTISLVRGRFTKTIDGSNNLPQIPAARYIGEVRGTFPTLFKAFRAAYLLVELDKTFAQQKPFLGFNTETETPGYALLNAGLGTDVFYKGKAVLNIHVSANNITNKTYQNHLSRLKYAAVNAVTGRSGVFNMGRNFSVKLNVPFSF